MAAKSGLIFVKVLMFYRLRISYIYPMIGIAFHCQTVYTDDLFTFFARIPGTVGLIGTGHFENLISDVVFSCSVAFYDSRDHILRYIVEVCKKLFGIFWQAVSAVSEAWVVIVGADTWIKTYTVDDFLCIQPFCLCISVKFIEVRHTKCEICICKQFNGFGFCESHEKSIDIFLDRALLEKSSEGISTFTTVMEKHMVKNRRSSRRYAG